MSIESILAQEALVQFVLQYFERPPHTIYIKPTASVTWKHRWAMARVHDIPLRSNLQLVNHKRLENACADSGPCLST